MKTFALILGLLAVAWIVAIGFQEFINTFVRGLMSGRTKNEDSKQPAPENQKETKDQ